MAHKAQTPIQPAATILSTSGTEVCNNARHPAMQGSNADVTQASLSEPECDVILTILVDLRQ